MTTIQIRIDEKTKKSAQKILDRIGIDMSTAIRAYLRQIVITKRIPFPLDVADASGVTAELKK